MFDYAIIGSGVSGGRIALDLVREGAKVVLIEAGKEFKSTKDFPLSEIDASAQLFWGGGIELNTSGKLGFLRGKCLGGTSVVNQALLDPFNESIWNEWRAISGAPFFSESSLQPYYEEVQKDLQVSSISEKHYNRNARIFIESFEELGYQWKPLCRAQGDCKLDEGTDCIACLGGCPRKSKQSTLVTLIPQARKLGLEVETEFEVEQIKHRRDQVEILGLQRGKKAEIRASKVVVAAGAFGTTKLLLQSLDQKKLPALGSSFSCHPQYMTYGYFKEPINAHKGAMQSVKSDDPKLRRAGYKFENVFAPPIATAMMIQGYRDRHLNVMKKYRYLASMEVCVRDHAVGKIELGRNQKLKITKRLTQRDKKRRREGLMIIEELFRAAGAKEVIHTHQGFGLHLMGGCPIGDHPKKAVVNTDFQVFDHPRIYVADSSIFPSSPGINPSLTIMALSHMAAKKALSS